MALSPTQAAGIDWLRRDIQAQRFTVDRFAEHCEISRSMASGILYGSRRPGEAMAARIAERMGRHDPGLYFPRSQVELDRAEAALMGPCS